VVSERKSVAEAAVFVGFADVARSSWNDTTRPAVLGAVFVGFADVARS